MLLEFLKWDLKNISHVIMRTLLRFFPPISNLLFYITLIIVFLIFPAIQYPINITSNIGIWTTNFIISPMDVELMGGYRCTREGYEYLCLRVFSKENLILVHFMLTVWWMYLLD